MSVAWIEHRFVGGVLALDVANTVVLRIQPEQRFDRFDDAAELPRFAEAASLFRSDEVGGQKLETMPSADERQHVLELREAIDSLFRDAATGGRLATDRLAKLLGNCAGALSSAMPEVSLTGQGASIHLTHATALSAIALLQPDRWQRIRICDNCGWLFLDRSRNGSRRWCDMTVCGNRQKARRFYERTRGA